MLNESRLLNFISNNKKISLQFFEGQKIIHDLALIHGVREQGFSYFRDIVLSTQPLMSLLKNNESFGIYIDSELPYFRFKVEMNKLGQMRTLMLPAEFNEHPSEITGLCRLAKTTPGQQAPYTSIIELDKINLKELTNHILLKSYQIEGEVFISEFSDQSVLIKKLPVEEGEEVSVRQEWLKIQKEVINCFRAGHNNDEDIIKEIESLGYMYLGSQEARFKCNCSLDRMLTGIRSLARGDLDSVFEGSTEVEVKCDYCHKPYNINIKMLSH